LDDALGYSKRKNKLVMDNFKSYITLIENQWYWRIDDQYGSTYKSTLSETEVYNVLEPFLENKRTMV